MFGLYDLHQMSGRVGRSNKKAFRYLVTPTILSLSSDAKRRLIALEEFSMLGDGLNIALKDLDIRTAGNLLVGEQSGFINDSKSFKIALRSIFCSCEEEHSIFDRCFDIYWRKKRHEYMPKTRTRKQPKIIKQTKESVVLVGFGDEEETIKDGARTVSGANKMESLRKTDF